MVTLKVRISASEGPGIGCMVKQVTIELIGRALKLGTIRRNNPKALLTQVYLGAVIGWGCRAVADYHMIVNEDVEFQPTDVKTVV